MGFGDIKVLYRWIEWQPVLSSNKEFGFKQLNPKNLSISQIRRQGDLIFGYIILVFPQLDIFTKLFLHVLHSKAEFRNLVNSVTKTIVYSKRTRTCHLLCKRPGCYHSASKTHVRDRIFKSTPIHASMIIRFPEFAEFSESSAPFKKNSIETPKFDKSLFCWSALWKFGPSDGFLKLSARFCYMHEAELWHIPRKIQLARKE